MAKLYFIYSTMNSGKSLELLKSAYNYWEQDKTVLCFTSEKDNRKKPVGKEDLCGLISTRVGLDRPAYLYERTDIFRLAEEKNPDCVLIDEAQFLSREKVDILTEITDRLDIPVMCYGLRADFRNNLFEGSAALFALADKIQEIKTICQFCNKKATVNMRLSDGRPVFEGQQIMIGGNESYVPVCRTCYKKQQDLVR